MNTELFELYRKEVGLSDFDSGNMSQAPINYQQWLEGRLIEGLRYEFSKWIRCEHRLPDFQTKALVWDGKEDSTPQVATLIDSSRLKGERYMGRYQYYEMYKGEPFWNGKTHAGIDHFIFWLPLPNTNQ